MHNDHLKSDQSIFGALSGPNNERGPTHAPMGLGPQNPTKKLAQLVDLLGQLLSYDRVSEIFRPELPPPLKIIYRG